MAHNILASNVIVLPDMDIDALMDASQADFLEEILARNTGLPLVQITRNNFCCRILRMIAKLSHSSRLSVGVRARVNAIQQRVNSTSTDH